MLLRVGLARLLVRIRVGRFYINPDLQFSFEHKALDWADTEPREWVRVRVTVRVRVRVRVRGRRQVRRRGKASERFGCK